VGVLWLIDDEAITEEDMDVVVATAERLVGVIARRRQAEDRATAEQEALVQSLIAGDPAAAARAAQDLLDRGLLPDEQHYLVFVSAPRVPRAAAPEWDALLTHARRFLQSAFTGENSTGRLSGRTRDGVATITASRASPGPEQAGRMAERLNKALIRRDTGLRWPSWVTAGGTATDALSDAARSYEQALRAMQVATLTERPVALWQTLEPLETVLTLLSQDLPEHLTPELLHTVRTRLSDEVRDTLRRFLDAAGDAAQVAQQLHVHRSTVYYRLTRAEQLLGVSLSDGRARTAVHLCLIADPTTPPSTRRNTP
jgi:hypothetical protein